MKYPSFIAAAAIAVALTVSASGLHAEAAPEVTIRPHAQLALDVAAPEILATTVDGKPASLAALRGKPVVLQFGSITAPIFRSRVPAVEKLAERYGDRVTFVVLYEREAHAADSADAIDPVEAAGFDIAAPTTQDERYKLAQQAIDRLQIKHEKVFVDAWSNTTALRYGNYPNMTFVVDADGKLRAGYAWMDPKKVQTAVDALLAGKPIPASARGTVRPGGSIAGDANGGYTSSGMEMTGGGAGLKLAMVIDQLKLTDEQKKNVFPALSQFIADLRNFRETRTGKVSKSAATQPDKDGKAAAPEDLQTAIEKLRDGAQKLKTVCRQSLSADQAQQIIDALNEGPARRIFADNQK